MIPNSNDTEMIEWLWSMVNLEGTGINPPPPPPARDTFERVQLIGLNNFCVNLVKTKNTKKKPERLTNIYPYRSIIFNYFQTIFRVIVCRTAIVTFSQNCSFHDWVRLRKLFLVTLVHSVEGQTTMFSCFLQLFLLFYR